MESSEMKVVADLLAQHHLWYVWVVEYGITHHRMVIALHLGGYPRRAAVELMDCTHFEGALQGGPYSLTLLESSQEGAPSRELVSMDGSLRVVFASGRVIRTLDR